MQTFTMQIPVHFSDSDASGRMSPTSVMRAMIESSMRHSDSVEQADFPGFWVLYQWDVDFHSFPKPGTTLQATTWTTGFYKFYAYRQFLLEENGQTVAEARTSGLLLSHSDQRPLRVPEAFAARYGSELLTKQLKTEKEPESFLPVHKEDIRVRSYHIDANQHVNNLVYADWVLEAIPPVFRSAHALKKMVLTYRKQIFYPDTVQTVATQEGAEIAHRIVDSKGETRAWARTRWE